MKCFVAQLTGDKHINVPADRIELRENTILAYDGDTLVAIADASIVVSAHISEKATEASTSHTQEQKPTQQPIRPQPPKQRPEPVEAGYRGFLYVKCEKCGATKGFCAKQPITGSRCTCGHITPLQSMKKLFVNCKCGTTFKYRTNLTDRVATVNCFICGSPVDLELHDKKGIYETIEIVKEN